MKTLSVKKLVNLTKFQLFSNHLHIYINTAIIVLNIIIAVIITKTSKSEGAGSGSLDAIYLAWIFTLGISFFIASFKFALISGVSRKTFYLSSIITLLFFTLALSVISSLLILLAESVARTFTLFSMAYGKNIGGLFVLLFSAGLFLAMLGWFIACIFYRTSKKQKLILAAALLLVPAILVLINYLTGRVMGTGMLKFLKVIMGFSSGAPNPYIASASFTVLGIIFCAAVYPLLMRAGIRE